MPITPGADAGEEASVITDAKLSRSDDISMRERRYAITMLVRIVCFGFMFVVPGWWKLVMLLGAGFLPAIAVVLANATDRRSLPMPRPSAEPTGTPALPSGRVIPGEVAEEP